MTLPMEGESRWNDAREFTRQTSSGRPLNLAERLVISAKTLLSSRSNKQPAFWGNWLPVSNVLALGIPSDDDVLTLAHFPEI